MSKPTFSHREMTCLKGTAKVIEFQILGGATTPHEFYEAIYENESLFIPPPGYGIILSGRGPIWGYLMMAHAAHPASWVGVYDPRLGVVIVESHKPGILSGEVIPFPEKPQ